jgi:D-arginine dehydrogenase
MQKSSMTSRYDVAIVGAGLVGASAAYHLSGHSRVVLIEQEAQPGYHSSGRSAAVLLPSYGGPLARALTRASLEFLAQPPRDFADAPRPLTAPRGAIFLAAHGQLDLLDHWRPDDAASESSAQPLSAKQATARVPILVAERISGALWLPDIKDIDAAAMLQGFIRGFRARSGTVLLNSKVRAIERAAGLWSLKTETVTVQAKILVNAAGAWADQVAALAGVAPVGLAPTRRTMVMVDAPPEVDCRGWPLVSDAAESFYFKPDGGRLVVSPADRSPIPAQDVQADEWDVAVAVERFEAATTVRVRRVDRKWAGLRTFAPDGEPVIGIDPRVPDFVWAAGLGGFGVQAAFAAGRSCAAVLGRDDLYPQLKDSGVDLERLAPARLTITPTDVEKSK